jgi:ribonuclease HI
MHSYYAAINKDKKTDVKNSPTPPFIKNSIAVDAACSGNPGDMEYRGVNVFNGEQLFIQGVYKEATNNIGEFLAIVHGLALLKKQNSDWPIYSDSITAISWIKAKKCKTKLERTANNAEVFARIEAAEKWLATNSYTTKIYKWDTKAWGEIPADFGRK